VARLPVTRRRRIALILGMMCGMAAPASGHPLRRATIWDLKVGAPVAAQPDPNEFRGFACGSNGGPPRAPLAGCSRSRTSRSRGRVSRRWIDSSL